MRLSYKWTVMMISGLLIGGCGADAQVGDDDGQYGYIGNTGENGSVDPSDSGQIGEGEELVQGLYEAAAQALSPLATALSQDSLSDTYRCLFSSSPSEFVR